MNAAARIELAPRYRTVFISDTHIGSSNCQAEALAEFLAAVRCESLYLAGDIVDLWWLTRRRATWGAAHARVIEHLRAWSLSEFLKRRSRAAERYIERFVNASVAEAHALGLDGVLCGHIHRPALIDRAGTIYGNDGDWVENLSAIVEHADGRLALLRWSGRAEIVAEIAPRALALAA